MVRLADGPCGDRCTESDSAECSQARSPLKPISRAYACKLWRSIADAAGSNVGSRIGTYSFRRAFAARLRDILLTELKDLGGWKTEKTVVGTHLQPAKTLNRLRSSALTERVGDPTNRNT